VFILGIVGVIWWKGRLDHERERAQTELVLRRTQMETEQAQRAAEGREQEQEAQRLYQQRAAEAERQRQEFAAQQERARIEAEATATRLSLESEKAKAKAEARAEARKAKREEERVRIETERIDREWKANEAAEEAERRRKKAEEFRRPLAMSAREVWRKGSALKGRTVVFKASATCTVFKNGTLLVKVYDPDTPTRLWVQGLVDRVEPGWNLDQGINRGVTVNLTAVVGQVGEAGAMQLTQCRVLGVD
jgi:hypothetical protein